jgi:enoyl-CoA hydratase
MLDRPQVRNAVDAAMSAAIEAAIDRLEDDHELRCGVLAHTGPVFCAGADLKAIAAHGLTGIETARGGFAGLCRRDRAKPLVVAVDGAAAGGGVEIALSGDIIVASTAARFSVPEVRRGLVALSGGTIRLARAVGRSVALDLVLTGDDLDATRAAELGLVSRLVEPGRAREVALAVAATIAANAPVAVRESRALVDAALDHDEGSLWAMAEAAAARVLATEDAREGPRAFAEKRPPRWLGR